MRPLLDFVHSAYPYRVTSEVNPDSLLPMSSPHDRKRVPIGAGKAARLFVIRHVPGLVAIPLVFSRLADLVVHGLDIGFYAHFFVPSVVLFPFIPHNHSRQPGDPEASDPNPTEE